MRPRLALAGTVLAALVCGAAPVKQLSIVKPLLNQYEDGPGVTPEFPFAPGETVFLSFQVDGYKRTPEQHIQLVASIDAFDPRGAHIVQTLKKEVKVDLAPEDKEWTPKFHETIMLPPVAIAGAYRIAISVEDQVAGTSTKLDVPLRLRGRNIEPAETLVARNFRFLRSEEDGQPLEVAAYRPGDTLWARFEIVGYKLGEKNHIHVEYALSVLSAAGKVLYTEPKAAVEDESAFYPKPFLPGILSLSLKPGTPAGEYSILLTLRDEVGNQTEESRHPFRIDQ
jgi:hypothetical protein